jgi:hypothetical protein
VGRLRKSREELWSRLGEGAKEDDVGEVDVLQSLGMLGDTCNEALEVGGLQMTGSD